MTTDERHNRENLGDDEAAAGESRDKRRSVESEISTIAADRDANYDRWLRAQAELENLRKRAQKEADETRKYAILSLVRDLLPGLDNLSRAIAAGGTTKNCEELIQGVELVYRQFSDALARHGVVPIGAVGESFDPNRHEAIQQMPSAEHEPMTVLQEAERGYMLHDRVVRPSRVIVSSAPSGTSPQSGDGRQS